MDKIKENWGKGKNKKNMWETWPKKKFNADKRCTKERIAKLKALERPREGRERATLFAFCLW